MKNLFKYLIAIMFIFTLFAMPASACIGFGCQQTDGSYYGEAYSSVDSLSLSDHVIPFPWASASATANGYTYGEVDTQASGYGLAQESGFVSGDDASHAFSYAIDGDHMSKSGAFASTEGSMWAGGEAFGLRCEDEVVDITTQIEGHVYQNNYSTEPGWGPNGVEGGSESGANFLASNSSYNRGGSFAAGLEGISGEAMTGGNTFVTIHPNGAHKSLFGTTNAFSKIDVGCVDNYQGYVSGTGFVNGAVMNGNTWGSASADFKYVGGNSGSGAAIINVNLYNGGNFSSVNVSGSSYATGTGTPSQD